MEVLFSEEEEEEFKGDLEEEEEMRKPQQGADDDDDDDDDGRYDDMPSLMGKYYSDLDLFKFFDLSFLKSLTNHKLMTRILHLSEFIKTDADYKRLLSHIFPRGESPPHTYEKDQLPTYDPIGGKVVDTPRKFLEYLKTIDSSRQKVGMNDREFRKHMRHAARGGARAGETGEEAPPPILLAFTLLL